MPEGKRSRYLPPHEIPLAGTRESDTWKLNWLLKSRSRARPV